MSQHRSPIFELADSYVEHAARTNPETATMLGITGYDHLLDDYSLEAMEAEAAFRNQTLATLKALEPIDDIDRISAAVMAERLGVEADVHETGERQSAMSVLWGPASGIRQIFEMTPSATDEQRENVRQRLEQVPVALSSWRETLEHAAARGQVTSLRQINGVAKQTQAYADGGMVRFVEAMCSRNGVEVTDALLSAARNAQRAYGELSEWLSGTLAPQSTQGDGVGAERYALWSRMFNGAALDLKATYEWGWQELEDITARMERVAQLIDPSFVSGSSLLPIEEKLNADPSHNIEGADEILTFLRELVEKATSDLEGTHFDIDPSIRACEVRLAPEGSAAAPYYNGPAEDLSRPGTTWLPIIDDSNKFSTWHLVSTWYHEGIPGHHLQIATATIEKDRLSRYQRVFGNTSGYAEGWALYSERFMDELGYFNNPGIEMGFLSAQAMRAARVIVDIGLHLHLSTPVRARLNGQDISGRVWDADLAREFMIGRALLKPAFAASEIDRYLGLPGQAIAYKVGEKHFLDARAEARTRLGSSFDLKAWHMYALRLGGMGLDTFRQVMASWKG